MNGKFSRAHNFDFPMKASPSTKLYAAFVVAGAFLLRRILPNSVRTLEKVPEENVERLPEKFIAKQLKSFLGCLIVFWLSAIDKGPLDYVTSSKFVSFACCVEFACFALFIFIFSLVIIIFFSSSQYPQRHMLLLNNRRETSIATIQGSCKYLRGFCTR